MEFAYFSRNGELLPVRDAKVPLSLVEYSYGFGVYENIRYAGGALYFVDDHVERLLESARTIELEHEFSADFVRRGIQELLKANAPKACNVKILLIGGNTPSAAQLFILCLNPLFPDRKLYRDGAAVITVPYERAFPHAKTLNMLQSFLAYRKAKQAGAYDALLVNRAGGITEGTRTNFFVLKDSTIFSAPEPEILLGVTRKAMLMAASQAGFRLEYRNIAEGSWDEYDGAFITSTSSKIVPIRSVNGRMVYGVIAPELARLMKVFGEFLEQSEGRLD